MAKVKNFFASAGNWIKNHLPTRRRIIQVYAALLSNANLKGYGEGLIYTGDAKVLCTPGLNCYSCPGAVLACPLGALQNSLGSSKTTTPYYIIGIIALFGLLLARTICGFLCPFGFFQEMLYKIKTPKVKKSAATRVLCYLKYLFLIVLVIAVPLIYKNVPGFCKYICPAGTFGGAGGLLTNSANSDLYVMLGYLFSWKFALLIVCIVACIFIYRAFCRFICPLGAIYGFFNKISLLGVKLDKSQCIECGACVAKCKMDIKRVGDHECINCGECISVCPTNAISWKGSKIFVKPTSVKISAANGAQEDLKPLNVYIENGTTLNADVAVGSTATIPAESAAPAEQEVERSAKADNVEDAQEALGVEEGEKKLTEAQPKIGEKSVTFGKKVKNCFTSFFKKFKNRAFAMEFTAWTLATALLVTALVYFNTRPAAGSHIGVEINSFSCKTYQTAFVGESEGNDDGKYVLPKDSGKPTVIIFWNSRSDIGKNYVSDFINNMYAEVKDSANYLIAHISNADSEETVQSIIDEKGWNTSELPFIQDTEELNLYNQCGGDGSPTMTVFLNYLNQVYALHSGAVALETIKEEIDTENVWAHTMFKVGDKLVDFTVDTYRSAYKENNFSTADARGKVLVINFWYVSCGPCVEELPHFNEVLEEYKAKGDEVVMLAIHANNGEKPQPFIDGDEGSTGSPGKVVWSDWNIIFGQDIGTNGNYYTALGGAGAYPMTVIINPEGYITNIYPGSIINGHKDALRPEIEKALGRAE